MEYVREFVFSIFSKWSGGQLTIQSTPMPERMASCHSNWEGCGESSEEPKKRVFISYSKLVWTRVRLPLAPRYFYLFTI